MLIRILKNEFVFDEDTSDVAMNLSINIYGDALSNIMSDEEKIQSIGKAILKKLKEHKDG